MTKDTTECFRCKGTGYVWSIEISGLRKRCGECNGTGNMERLR